MMKKKKLLTPPCYISRVPSDIIKYIFCKLPITALLQCKSVCNSWRRMILDSNFPNFYHKLSITRQPSTLIICIKDRNLFWVEFQGQSRFINPAAEILYTRPARLASRWDYQIHYINSCNGLICLCRRSVRDPYNYDTYLLNPITGEYIILPPCEEGRTSDWTCWGFGYCSNANQFKVVRISSPRIVFLENKDFEGEEEEEDSDDDDVIDEKIDDEERIHVWTVGDSTWRTLPSDLWIYEFEWCPFDAFFNGCFHWIVGYTDAQHEVVAFDFEMEIYKTFKLPPVYYQDDECVFTNLGVFSGECLFCGFIYYESDYMEVWMMEKYGAAESWVKMYIIGTHPNVHFGEWSDIEIKLLENGDILFLCDENLFLYNPGTKSYTMLQIDGNKSEIYAFVHNPSLASLRNVVGDSSMIFNAKTEKM